MPRNIEIIYSNLFSKIFMMTNFYIGMYFQQDNASAHKTRETMTRIHEFYDDRVIQFPPRSPDLTILDFFIFPYLKNTIFKNNPHNLEELQEAISNALSVILNKTTLSIIAFIFFKLKRLNMRTIIKLTITSHLFSQSIGILSNRIKKIPPTLIYILNDRTV
jgi:hypothetical protein